MIKSMTGFGRCEIAEGERKFTVEMKSVNHRYLDINIKMPKKLNFFESAIRNFLKTYMERGKVDMFITYEDLTESHMVLKYNEDIAAGYMKYMAQMAEQFDLENDMTVSRLARYPDVFVMEEQTVDEKEIWALLEKALKGACEQFVQTRITEGENLKTDILGKLDDMVSKVDFIEERSPQIVEEYRTKLTDKVQELLTDGTLDFIAQEMNREANTTLSKANDIQVSNVAIDLKTEIEKIREQIQNLE